MNRIERGLVPPQETIIERQELGDNTQRFLVEVNPRFARKEGLQDLVDQMVVLYMETYANQPPLFESMSQSSVGVFFAKLAKDGARFLGLINQEGTLEAMAILEIFPRAGKIIGLPSEIKKRTDSSTFLREIIVAPQSRRSGLGSQLLKECEELSQQAGKEYLFAQTDWRLLPAINFYRKRGFAQLPSEGERPLTTFFIKSLGTTESPFVSLPPVEPPVPTEILTDPRFLVFQGGEKTRFEMAVAAGAGRFTKKYKALIAEAISSTNEALPNLPKPPDGIFLRVQDPSSEKLGIFVQGLQDIEAEEGLRRKGWITNPERLFRLLYQSLSTGEPLKIKICAKVSQRPLAEQLLAIFKQAEITCKIDHIEDLPPARVEIIGNNQRDIVSGIIVNLANGQLASFEPTVKENEVLIAIPNEQGEYPTLASTLKNRQRRKKWLMDQGVRWSPEEQRVKRKSLLPSVPVLFIPPMPRRKRQTFRMEAPVLKMEGFPNLLLSEEKRLPYGTNVLLDNLTPFIPSEASDLRIQEALAEIPETMGNNVCYLNDKMLTEKLVVALKDLLADETIKVFPGKGGRILYLTLQTMDIEVSNPVFLKAYKSREAPNQEKVIIENWPEEIKGAKKITILDDVWITGKTAKALVLLARKQNPEAGLTVATQILNLPSRKESGLLLNLNAQVVAALGIKESGVLRPPINALSTLVVGTILEERANFPLEKPPLPLIILNKYIAKYVEKPERFRKLLLEIASCLKQERLLEIYTE